MTCIRRLGVAAVVVHLTLGACQGSSQPASSAVPPGNVAPPTSASYPLRTEAGKRYLVDAQGNAFLIHGDTAWSLMVQLTREEADQYLEDRRLKGFNTVLVNLIEHEFASNAPLNRYGQAPFTTPGDFATPNEAYFAHADYVIGKAAEKGLLVMLTPAYAGFGGGSQGWWQEMQANGATKLRAYGQYLGNRYRGFSNILWVHGGDYNVPDKDLVRAIVNGIRDVETVSLHTYHGSRGTGALEFFTTAEPWLTVSNIYTDNTTVVAEAYAEYARSGLPFFLIEALYENEGLDASGVRAQAYQAVLSGAFGQLMGNSPIWFFGQSWQQALNSAGARSMQRMRELLNGFAWWKLVPDTNASFVTAGLSSGSGRTAAARANDASFGLVYVAFNHSITVNTTLLSGPRIMARWCDPAPNGACSTISGSPFNPSPAHSFTPPGNNSSGSGDWVLALTSVP